MYCVYMHRNKVNGKVYIGMTNDVKRRWRQGGTEYKSTIKFFGAIRKYGFDSFEHIILVDGLTKEQASIEEKKYIALYDATNRKKGYNFSEGGTGGRVYKNHPRNMLGKHQTAYQIKHQKAFMSNAANNPMRNGQVVWGKTHPHPRGFLGKTRSPEERARISQTLKDKKAFCKSVRAIYPDGSSIDYGSMKEAEAIGLTKPVILKLLRSGLPFDIAVINQYSKKNAHLIGVRFEYIQKDNTEVTGETKETPAP